MRTCDNNFPHPAQTESGGMKGSVHEHRTRKPPFIDILHPEQNGTSDVKLLKHKPFVSKEDFDCARDAEMENMIC